MLKDITLSILHDVVMKAIKSSDCHSIIHQSYRRKGEHHRIDEYSCYKNVRERKPR